MALIEPIRRIRNQADVDEGLRQLLTLDPRLEPIAEGCGRLPLRLSAPGFSGLASIIVSQMISRASADAIWGRMGERLGPDPQPAEWLSLSEADIAGFGLSRAKAGAIHTVANAVQSGALDLSGVCDAGAEEAMAALVALKGIGPWTAEVYLMFCGGHPDIFPAGDVALRSAVGHGILDGERPSIAVVTMQARAWQPYRSIAARLFWSHYAKIRGRAGMPV